MRWRSYLYFLFGCTVIWFFIFEIFILRSVGGKLAGYFRTFDKIPSRLKSLFHKAPILEERLILIDNNILRLYANAENESSNASNDCIFCQTKKNQPIAFALLCPTNTSLEEQVLLPILKAWEIGFWVESVSSSKPRKFSTYHANLPLGFILQKDEGALVVEIVLLHEREGDFWWHGSFYHDSQYSAKFSNLGISSVKNDLVLSHEGALDKFQFKSTVIDDIKVNVPENIPSFLRESTDFIECNYEQAEKFYQKYGKQQTAKDVMFIHKAHKILSSAKTVLDQLQIPFWISSGTLLGYFRQCDIIPYSLDVDIGVFIQDHNEKIIDSFKSAHFFLKHKFGRLNEGYELSFVRNDIKLDIFFFYDGGQYYWNGGHRIFMRKNNTFGAYKYKYTFPKFTLCWTDFLDLKVRIPCQTETYIKANYGPSWFIPISKWNWYRSPFNVQLVGEWKSGEIPEVIKIFK